MNKKPNIFISYRRSGGEDFAGRLFSDLRHDGYDLSFDVETFRPGKFNKQIYYHINKCNAVILILPPNALDRCVNEGDWLRLEIAHALKKKKLIIPIMLRGFTWPDELPKDIDDVRYYHGLTYESSLYSEIYKKLLGLLDKAFSSKTGPKPAPDEVKVDTVSKKSHSRGNDTGKTLDPTPKSKDKPFPWIEFSPLCKEILSFLLKYFLLPILIATIGFLLLFSADLMLSFWLFPSLPELINQYISVDFDTFLSLMEKVNPCLFLPIWILCNLIGIPCIGELARGIKEAQFQLAKDRSEVPYEAITDGSSIKASFSYASNISLTEPPLTIAACQKHLSAQTEPFVLQPFSRMGQSEIYVATLKSVQLTLSAANTESPVDRFRFRFLAKNEDKNESLLNIYAGCPTKNSLFLLVNQGFTYVQKTKGIHRFRSPHHTIFLRCRFGVVQEIEVVWDNASDPTIPKLLSKGVRSFLSDLWSRNILITCLTHICCAAFQILFLTALILLSKGIL